MVKYEVGDTVSEFINSFTQGSVVTTASLAERALAAALESHYQRRMRSHQGLKYPCDQCDKTFVDQGKLKGICRYTQANTSSSVTHVVKLSNKGFDL